MRKADAHIFHPPLPNVAHRRLAHNLVVNGLTTNSTESIDIWFVIRGPERLAKIDVQHPPGTLIHVMHPVGLVACYNHGDASIKTWNHEFQLSL